MVDEWKLDLKYFCSMAKKGGCHWDGTFLNLVLTRRPCSDNKWREKCSSVLHGTTPFTYFERWIFKNFERSNNLLMTGGIFLCLNQVMLRRHVLDHCKNEHRHIYTKTKSTQIPGSMHLQWARGEEYSWSSLRSRSVATDRSSHPVGLSEEEERKWLIAFWS